MVVVKLGIIGLGRGLMLTLPALRVHPDIRIVAAFDPDSAALQAFATDFGSMAYAKTDLLLANDDLDAVYIVSPHEFHEEQAIAALDAGKHVLLDKPMALGLAACNRIVSASDGSGRVVVVGPSHGADPCIDVARGLIDGGHIGRPRSITALNFTDYIYRPRRPAELEPARGGGVLWGQAPHHIDLVRRLSGQAVLSVSAALDCRDMARPVDGAYTATLRFADDSVATLAYSGYGRFDSDILCNNISELGRAKKAFEPGAAKRALRAEGAAKRKRGYGASIKAQSHADHNEHFGFILVSGEYGDMRVAADAVTVFADGPPVVHPVPLALPARTATIDIFVAAVSGLPIPAFDARWGRDTVAICKAMLASSRSGASVILDKDPL